MRRMSLFIITILMAVVSSSSSAFAWGCFARAYNGAYGYSYHYNTRSAAVARAIGECNARGPGCYIVSCSRYR